MLVNTLGKPEFLNLNHAKMNSEVKIRVKCKQLFAVRIEGERKVVTESKQNRDFSTLSTMLPYIMLSAA